MSHQNEEFLEFATDLASAGSEIAVAGFGLARAWRKSDGSLVTRTDQQIDALLTERIAATFPAHAILSEERSTAFDASAEYTWVIDPVDGTTNYARGLPVWGVSVALLHGGTPVVGVVDFPLLGERFAAALGHGASRNRETIVTAAADQVDDQNFLMKCTRTDALFDIRTPLKVRVLGSAAYHVCKVADGSALVGIEATPKVWDLAAAYLIVAEAGGLLTRSTGESIFPLPALSMEYAEIISPIFVAANTAMLDYLHRNVAPRAIQS
jgi:myo-inositol-1(or 4)-monophosphatase